MDKEKELIDYPTIKAAVAGEAWQGPEFSSPHSHGGL